MLVHLFREVNGEDKKKLMAVMEKPREEKTENEVKWVVGLMKKCGSLDNGKNLAEKFAKQAEEIFEKKLTFLKCQPARSQIKAGIEFIIKREY